MRNLFLIVLISFFNVCASSQDTNDKKDYDVNGYLSGIPSIFWNDDTTMWQALLHNRLNFEYTPTGKLSFSLQVRNQLFAGNLTNIENYNNGFEKGNHFLPLTYYHNFNNDYLLSSSIDRFWLQYTANKLEIKAGRQRINWGQTFVWSTNDVFNTYNFFEFDYPERPGVDAIRVQYYTSNTSSLDVASKIDSSGNISAGVLYRFNMWEYDFQVMSAFLQEPILQLKFDSTLNFVEKTDRDIALGIGFSGSVKQFSLRGEASYFNSLNTDIAANNQFLLSLSTDRTFNNDLTLMFEFFYADKTNVTSAMNILGFSTGSQNVKSQTFTHYNLFGQVSYPINPIINANISGMYMFDDTYKAIYAGPGVDISLSDNITLSALMQVFYYKMENAFINSEKWENLNFGYLRVKWNF